MVIAVLYVTTSLELGNNVDGGSRVFAMKIDILSKGAFESALVHLESGEEFV